MTLERRELPDAAAIASAAAEEIARAAADAVAARGRFRLVLAGGHTPEALYRLLSSPPWRQRIDWPKVALLFGDERCVPPDDPRSNQRMVRLALLGALAAPPAAYLPMDGAAPDAAARYEGRLRGELGDDPPDLLLLGLGPDGHTASIFPGSPALEERSRWVVAVPPPTTVPPPIPRLTLTPPLLIRARRTLVLATGAEKQAALARALAETGEERETPARLVRRSEGEVSFFFDPAAGRALS